VSLGRDQNGHSRAGHKFSLHEPDHVSNENSCCKRNLLNREPLPDGTLQGSDVSIIKHADTFVSETVEV